MTGGSGPDRQRHPYLSRSLPRTYQFPQGNAGEGHFWLDTHRTRVLAGINQYEIGYAGTCDRRKRAKKGVTHPLAERPLPQTYQFPQGNAGEGHFQSGNKGSAALAGIKRNVLTKPSYVIYK